MFAFGESVIHHVFEENGEDEYGKVLESWRDETWDGVAFAPDGSAEPVNDNLTRVETSGVIYDPAGRFASSRDEFTVRGERYYVVGEGSGVWTHPLTGWSPGSTINLKKITGG